MLGCFSSSTLQLVMATIGCGVQQLVQCIAMVTKQLGLELGYFVIQACYILNIVFMNGDFFESPADGCFLTV